MNPPRKKLTFLGLNEIYFPIIRGYVEKNKDNFPNFLEITSNKNHYTLSCENQYELLEPWIQWPSIFNGKKYNEHKIFRLGDVVKKQYEQIFERVEKEGFSVGAISPMNASNQLNNPDFFIPDPWTKTSCDESITSKLLTKAITQGVNDNSSSKITLSSLLFLLYVFLLNVRIKSYSSLFLLAISSINKPWRRAIFLDVFLNEVFVNKRKKKGTEFTFIFLNAGAHIQHHYFHNSPYTNEGIMNPDWYIRNNLDPLKELIVAYEKILNDHLNLKDHEVVISTGLSQSPTKKLIFYYRLRKHQDFLENTGISFKEVFPRMTRDFLITFESNKERDSCSEILKSASLKKKKVFEIEIREKELFVTLCYEDEITREDLLSVNRQQRKFLEDIAFVALKNGDHLNKSFTYLSNGVEGSKKITNGDGIESLHETVYNYFTEQGI